VVNSQKIYESMDDYAAAVKELDELASSNQKNIDEAFKKLEEMYNNYMVAKDGLSYEDQQSREQAIIDNETKITKYQQSVFGADGIIAKKQEELITPFQEKVEKAMDSYAQANGIDILIDVATTSVPYYSAKVDVTDAIIKTIK
jgi:outer membrane protein